VEHVDTLVTHMKDGENVCVCLCGEGKREVFRGTSTSFSVCTFISKQFTSRNEMEWK